MQVEFSEAGIEKLLQYAVHTGDEDASLYNRYPLLF